MVKRVLPIDVGEIINRTRLKLHRNENKNI